jgi:hypothetical protein
LGIHKSYLTTTTRSLLRPSPNDKIGTLSQKNSSFCDFLSWHDCFFQKAMAEWHSIAHQRAQAGCSHQPVFRQESDVKALAHYPMTQQRRNASVLASRALSLTASLHSVLNDNNFGSELSSESNSNSRTVICTGMFGSKWNTSSTSSGGSPQVAGG